MTSLPRGVPGRLEIHESDDGLIVYQESTDRVHHLNHTAAVILELCDGTRTVEEIVRTVGEVFGLKTPPEEQTKACIQRLVSEGLLYLGPSSD
jgi:hypothetical protein